MFRKVQIFPGIFHITDAMGVSFTLIEGEKKAVLFDTGYGIENVASYIVSMTDKPLTVLLSHGHHDHVLGARWFEKTWMSREDMEEFSERTARLQRMKVRRQAEEKNISVPRDFLEATIQLPQAIPFKDVTAGFDSIDEDLGGLMIRIIRVPGHTPGSIVIHIPAYGLLLTGDNWNPCTWMWFPTSINANRWRDNMISLIKALEQESGKEIANVLCSHQPALRDGTELKRFLEYMTDERMKNAPKVDMDTLIDTHQITKDQWSSLVFDYAKIR